MGNSTGSTMYMFGAVIVIYLVGVLIYQGYLWIKKKREKVDSLIENSDIIKNVLDHPRINISLVEDNLDTSQCLINTFKYTKLITKLYDFINDI